MFKKSLLLVLSIMVALSLGFSACSSSSQPASSSTSNSTSTVISSSSIRGLTGAISTGKTIVAAAALPVGPAGGKLSVTEAGMAIAGLEITVPAGSYKDKRDFKISYAPIEKHTFGENFNPITPLISVENGGDYAAEDMLISLPVNIPEGKFAMGFLYDEKTKILEGMPVMAESAASITVTTRHFSSFVISIIDKFKLKKDIDTGFRPGIDDWQFVNNGSYIAIGHCAGQSVSAMWYYYNQPDGKDLTLYGRYDNNGQQPATPGFQLDDSLGYRLASVVQADLDWDSWASQFFNNQRGINDELAWDMFAYSMQFSGQPQYVGLNSNSGGHAIICYRIKDGNLYVADPNYPGNTERRIEYAGGHFSPYESGANFEEIQAGKSISYTKIGYVAQSSRVDWNKMKQRWTEFKNKTIGNNIFPESIINYKDVDGKYKPLQDGYISQDSLIEIRYQNLSIAGEDITVFRDGQELGSDAQHRYELKPGNNLLGIYLHGVANGQKKYVDFKYFNVVYGGLALKPAVQEMEPNIERIFNLSLTDPAPKGSHFEWFVDGALKDTGTNFSIRVSFPNEGQHTIICKIVGADGKVVLQAQGTATVKAASRPTVSLNNLAAVKAMKYIKLNMSGKWSLVTKAASGETTKVSPFSWTIPWYPQAADPDLAIVWSGNSFSGKQDTGRNRGEVKGTVSDDGLTLTSLEWTDTNYSDNGQANSPWKTEAVITMKFKNIAIPQLVFEKATENKFNFVKSGPTVKEYVTDISYKSVTQRNGVVETEITSLPNSIAWDAGPALNVWLGVNRSN